MFNFLGNRSASDYLKLAKQPYGVKMPDNTTEVNDDNTSPIYQIGKTADGRTTLQVSANGIVSTLIMTNEGVDTLIRMLEASKEAESENKLPSDV